VRPAGAGGLGAVGVVWVGAGRGLVEVAGRLGFRA
jgi:hypothetical protein